MNYDDVIWILGNKYEINVLGKTSLKTMRKNILLCPAIAEILLIDQAESEVSATRKGTLFGW